MKKNGERGMEGEWEEGGKRKRKNLLEVIMAKAFQI